MAVPPQCKITLFMAWGVSVQNAGYDAVIRMLLRRRILPPADVVSWTYGQILSRAEAARMYQCFTATGTKQSELSNVGSMPHCQTQRRQLPSRLHHCKG